mgnify:CR=1 FL=1
MMEKKLQEPRVNKIKISVEHLTKNPRIGKIEIEEQKFFAYEKQKSHN